MSAPADAFTLDPRLDADTLPVGELSICAVRLMDDARFPWLVLVPKRPNLADLVDLAGDDARIVQGEIWQAGTVLRSLTACHKLNIASLGNVVRQLHIHVLARFENDVAWPKPVWGHGTAASYDPASADTLITRLRAEFGMA